MSDLAYRLILQTVDIDILHLEDDNFNNGVDGYGGITVP
jgi:hypothetical protein